MLKLHFLQKTKTAIQNTELWMADILIFCISGWYRNVSILLAILHTFYRNVLGKNGSWKNTKVSNRTKKIWIILLLKKCNIYPSVHPDVNFGILLFRICIVFAEANHCGMQARNSVHCLLGLLEKQGRKGGQGEWNHRPGSGSGVRAAVWLSKERPFTPPASPWQIEPTSCCKLISALRRWLHPLVLVCEWEAFIVIYFEGW